MKRVAVTTDRFSAVADIYAGAGLEPVRLACVTVVPAVAEALDAARRAAASAELVFVTSARTVDLLWPDGTLPPVEFAAVATATAAVLRDRGGEVGVVGSSGLAALVDAAGDRLGGDVVFPRAAGSDPAALEMLRSRAPRLREIVVYRTVPVAPELTPVDAVAFASPSGVDGWRQTRDLDGVVVGAIGQTTASALERVDVIAPEPSHAALAQVLASHMEVSV